MKKLIRSTKFDPEILEREKMLKGKVENLIDLGLLTNAETVEKGFFVVCKEYAADDVLINPRIQLMVHPMFSETKRFVGKKVGDVLYFKQSDSKAEITEIYGVKNEQ